MDFLGNSVTFFAALFAVIQRNTLNAGVVGMSVSFSLQVGMTIFFDLFLFNPVYTGNLPGLGIHGLEVTTPGSQA